MKKFGKGPISAGLAVVVALAVPLTSKWEGRSLTPYQDIVGVWTICDGETLNVRQDGVATHQECDTQTKKRVTEFATAIDEIVTVPLSPKTHAALTVWSYNVGLASAKRSTLIRKINRKEYKAACDELLKWVCVTVSPGTGDASGQCVTRNKNKRLVNGLLNRRLDERKMCLEGV